MTFLRKKPVFLAIILGLVAISSFAVSYSVMTSVSTPVSSGLTVIGGSCCSVDTAGATACALETEAQTTAAVDSCCAVGTEVNTANAELENQNTVASTE